MGKTLVELQHVSKMLDGQQVLSDIHLSLYAGEICGLIGDNGAGKSVLVNLLSGVYPPDKGVMYFQGEICNLSSPREALKRGIVTIYQDCNLIPELTVAENLCIGKWYYKGHLIRRIDWNEIRQQAEKWLEKLNCEISPLAKVSDLSYAQQRLVEIVKALSQNAKVLIMDEPYESLTPAEMQSVSKAIEQLCQSGVSVLYISHRIEELLTMCSHVTILREGKILTSVVCNDERECQRFRAELSAIYQRRKFPRIFSEPGRTVLEAKNLSTERGLQKVSFQLCKGEVLGIAGRVGSGRTALARALFGMDKLKSGTISINGTDVKFSSPADAVKAHVGYIPDGGHTESLFQNLEIAGNITISNLQDIYSGPWLNLRTERIVSERFQRKLFIHTSDGSQKIHQLSSGNRQKVLFSRWIFTNSRVLIMDEPTKGIDKSGKIEVYNIINKLVMEGKSVILISSDFYELMGMSDRIIVLNEGTITREISRSMFSSEKLLYEVSGSA